MRSLFCETSLLLRLLLCLLLCLQDTKEHAMVRHEAAEALGSVADAASVALLKQFAQDPEPIVAHSCVVALDMLEHEASGSFEYADTGTQC
jgi:deoxyhypusine monooxygenase